MFSEVLFSMEKMLDWGQISNRRIIKLIIMDYYEDIKNTTIILKMLQMC